ncbi:hypothetical protein HDU99_010141, partial [Rhizoclosmatium hyalinum]
MASGRPTHFLSLRLDSAAFRPFHNHVNNNHPALAHHLVPQNSHHITVLLLTLTPGNLASALNCLEACAQSVIPKHFPAPATLDLNIKGIGTFGNGKVVWAKVIEDVDKKLTRFAEDVQALFADYGLLQGRYDFRPHATLMKIGGSRSASASGNSRGQGRGGMGGRGNQIAYSSTAVDKIDAQVYLPFSQFDFGVHTVGKLELSAMGKMAEDGYYT